VNGVAIPKARVDAIVKAQAAQGQPDSEQLRTAVRERLIELEVLAQEANKKGLAKNPDFQQQIELQRQQALANALVQDYIKANPVDDAAAKVEYDKIRTQAGDKEYKARHILVDKEDEAKDIVAKLKGGQKFEELAKVSKDPGSKDRGGDLDWNSPAAYVKPFSDALVKLQKGQYTMVPVQTQFGWHVILLEDVRPTKFPPFDDVKNELKQRIQQQNVAKYVGDLRSKAKVQ
jgi:peptidyl-prolyl cis-trans isomerase C